MRQIKAIEKANRERLLKVNPDLADESGIYRGWSGNLAGLHSGDQGRNRAGPADPVGRKRSDSVKCVLIEIMYADDKSIK